MCWGIIDKCNSNLSLCPFDILSYHRKGVGKAEDIIVESLDLLLNNIYIKFPNLRKKKISNRFEYYMSHRFIVTFLANFTENRKLSSLFISIEICTEFLTTNCRRYDGMMFTNFMAENGTINQIKKLSHVFVAKPIQQQVGQNPCL